MNLRFAANLSLLYAEVPFLERFGRAARAGFSYVEFMFPYSDGVDAARARLDETGLRVALFNLHAGDTEAGEWGTLSNPARRDYFRWSLDTALAAAGVLGCARLNAMYGQQVPGLAPEAQAACAVENLAWAAPLAAQAGVTLLVEPLNPIDWPQYALLSTAAGLRVVADVTHPAVRLQYDVYHATLTGDDVPATLATHLASIGHIQVADVPGRHEPGTGGINFARIFALLEQAGYGQIVGLEYRPLGDTDAGLRWLPRAARGATADNRYL